MEEIKDREDSAEQNDQVSFCERFSLRVFSKIRKMGEMILYPKFNIKLCYKFCPSPKDIAKNSRKYQSTYLFIRICKVGLSSSQARLLTLTSRLHSVEGEAHRIQANKLRLANDSDAVYAKYINALDETSLQTLQTSTKTGADCWIGGSLNNLLRYGTSEDYTGNVFYAQDIASGKLYLPEFFAGKYTPGMSMEDFVTSCDSSIVYTSTDLNAYMLRDYENVIKKGYNTVASDEILNRYQDLMFRDSQIKTSAQKVMNALPKTDDNGIYVHDNPGDNYVKSFYSAIEELKNNNFYETTFTESDKFIIDGAVSLAQFMAVCNVGPKDKPVEVEESWPFRVETSVTYEPSKFIQTANNVKYAESATFDEYNALLAMFNGGTITWQGNEKTIQSLYLGDSTTPYDVGVVDKDYEESFDVYEYFYIKLNNGLVRQAREVLNEYANNAENFAVALTNIMEKTLNNSNRAQEYLESVGKTEEDLHNYITYINAKSDYEAYEPHIVTTANDTVKAAYYEQIFKAIEASGGCISVPESRAKNDSWVGNMIKSAQIILTAWDVDKDVLSKTAPSLNTHIQEVCNNDAVEKAEQEYEAELNIINDKDARYDRRLSTLETERSAITSEMDSLKQIMKNNVDSTFKLFT